MQDRVVLKRAGDQARDVIRSLILAGELAPESRLEEVSLAGRLGVSRTPVREALAALEHEGLVRSRAQRGYVVVRPDAAMVRESYPILNALETAAVRAAGDRLRAAAPALKQINERMLLARTKTLQYTLDRAFHVGLTERCGNPRLLELLRNERGRAEIIDGAHRRGLANREGSHAEHAKIVEALAAGATERAVAVLDTHWRNGMEVVIRWLSESGREG